MRSPLLEHVAVFANSDGANEHAKEFLKLLSERPDIRLTVIGLAEKLPGYTRFPAGHRKERIEALIETAARSVVADLIGASEAAGITSHEEVLVSGRFPGVLLDWIHAQDVSLVVKESLPCDDHHGNASKGDIRLARHSRASVLLAHAPIRRGGAIVVAIAPYYTDPQGDAHWIELVETAAMLAQLFQAPLHVVHAWSFWGENLIRSRAGNEECERELETEKAHALDAFERVLNQAQYDRDTTKTHLVKGSPTRALSDLIDQATPSLVVLGPSASDGPLSGLLGTTAESIAVRKETSVLILKRHDAKRPD